MYRVAVPYLVIRYSHKKFFFKFLRVLLYFLEFRIRVHMFLGIPDPDQLFRGMDPDPALEPAPSFIKLK